MSEEDSKPAAVESSLSVKAKARGGQMKKRKVVESSSNSKAEVLERKRAISRLSSQRLREREKFKADSLQQDHTELTAKNQALRIENEEIRNRINMIKRYLPADARNRQAQTTPVANAALLPQQQEAARSAGPLALAAPVSGMQPNVGQETTNAQNPTAEVVARLVAPLLLASASANASQNSNNNNPQALLAGLFGMDAFNNNNPRQLDQRQLVYQQMQAQQHQQQQLLTIQQQQRAQAQQLEALIRRQNEEEQQRKQAHFLSLIGGNRGQAISGPDPMTTMGTLFESAGNSVTSSLFTDGTSALSGLSACGGAQEQYNNNNNNNQAFTDATTAQVLSALNEYLQRNANRR